MLDPDETLGADKGVQGIESVCKGQARGKRPIGEAFNDLVRSTGDSGSIPDTSTGAATAGDTRRSK
jgi:hypothetical protein